MEKYSLEKHRKLIESIRLYVMIILAILVFLNLLNNIILGFSIALVIGLIDQIFIKPKLKPKKKEWI